MTRLRQIMLEELERRNYSEGTIRCYLRAVADFARYFHRSPDQLRPEHVRQYQAYLFRERKLQATSVTQRLAALRFFFLKTLKKRWGMEETPYPKKVRRLPTILSQEEVARLVDSALTPFYRILVMTLYATGARCAEVARLQVGDIDSQRMVVHIRGGKGRKDREVMHHRLVSLIGDQVTFRWRDSANANQQRLMTLSVEEFLRRFLLHVLPPGFVRIRHFGFLAHRRRAQLLPHCFRLLQSATGSPQAQPPTPEHSELPSTPSPASPWA